MNQRTAALLDRRMLAAIRPVDPLGRPIVDGVTLASAGAKFLTKSDGTVILQQWSELPGFDREFDSQPANPAPGSRTITIEMRPRSGKLLPRLFTLDLPRDPDPANATDPASLFKATEPILPAATAMPIPGHACGHIVSVVRDNDDAPIAGAIIRLAPDDAPQSATVGLTNGNGEAMIVLAGLPLAKVGAGAQLTPDHPATLQLFVDPAVIRADGQAADLLDPDSIMAATAAASSTAVTMRAGTTTRSELRWSPP